VLIYGLAWLSWRSTAWTAGSRSAAASYWTKEIKIGGRSGQTGGTKETTEPWSTPLSCREKHRIAEKRRKGERKSEKAKARADEEANEEGDAGEAGEAEEVVETGETAEIVETGETGETAEIVETEDTAETGRTDEVVKDRKD